LLITAELVGRPKVSRLMKLLKKSPDTLAVVDHPDNVAELQEVESVWSVLDRAAGLPYF
jgi:hypothetical protein